MPNTNTTVGLTGMEKKRWCRSGGAEALDRGVVGLAGQFEREVLVCFLLIQLRR